ncbi:MAG: ferrous iron transport protein B [Candidatus Brocadiia bacterium]
MEYRIALAGNPNCGKTTIFNRLTGLRAETGNYPGVTVEKAEGIRDFGHDTIRITDLPGTYALTSNSPDEKVARDFLLSEGLGAAINVIDSCNLERHLFLTTQLCEMGVPLVVALNMADGAREQGIAINPIVLSQALGARCIPTVGTTGEGQEEALSAAVAAARSPRPSPLTIDYGPDVEREISRIGALLHEAGASFRGAPVRWTALKLIEGDEEVAAFVRGLPSPIAASAAEEADRGRTALEEAVSGRIEVFTAGMRYAFIACACNSAVSREPQQRSTSDRLDAILTNRYAGIPIFLAMMYIVFYLTFRISDYPVGWLDQLFGWVAQTVTAMWPQGQAEVLRSLVVNGIIGGVGGVLIFLPAIVMLFLCIALLEGSGYMARAAYLMDRAMRAMGLSGKSFIPMLVGFGCTVPAVLAARTIDNRRDRFLTILVLPLISCGARLPVYALLIPAFFPARYQGPVLWGIYVSGILLAVALAFTIRKAFLKGGDQPFVIELPPYRLPALRSLLLISWDRAKSYLAKAFTVIMAISILLWLLGNFPRPSPSQLQGLAPAEANRVAMEQSALGRIGKFFEPVSLPLGFDWKINTALIGASAAKEVFVAQIGVLNSLAHSGEEEVALRESLRRQYPPLTGLAILLFILIASPCAATVAAVRRETASWKFAAFQWLLLTVLAYVVALVAVSVGRIV